MSKRKHLMNLVEKANHNGWKLKAQDCFVDNGYVCYRIGGKQEPSGCVMMIDPDTGNSMVCQNSKDSFWTNWEDTYDTKMNALYQPY